MFVRIKKSGKNQYLQLVQSRRERGKVKQHVIGTLGRLDKLKEKGEIEKLVRSLSRFSEKALIVISGSTDVEARAKKIGSSLVFEKLWTTSGIRSVLKNILKERNFEFDVERVIFTTVLHRLMTSGSDRNCDYWRRDYKIAGSEEILLHHFYRAMAFLGEIIDEQKEGSIFSIRRIKDIVEEELFQINRDLFTGLEIVFFDTTSIYFEGEGGETLGELGNSKDHRPDLKQMIVGVILDDNGKPLCCEMWPGNTADVTTLLPIVEIIQKRFDIKRFCIVADRGMISKDTIEHLESKDNPVNYILGARMRKVKEVRDKVLSCGGRYREVYPELNNCKSPSPLKVKEVSVNGKRYVLCLNTKQARKDAHTRENIINSLQEQLKKGVKSLVGNKGYRKYLKVKKKSIEIDLDKIKYEERFDGKWVLQTNMKLSSEEVALKYKELWQVENVFRNMKSLLETRPIFHRGNATITGHVFCSFLALILLKELYKKLEKAGYYFEWSKVKQDIKSLEEVVIQEDGKKFAIRTECLGNTGKIFNAVGVAIPPTVRQL